MRVIVQRVDGAELKVDGKTVSKINKGLTVFFGAKTGDEESSAKFLAKKVANLRIFRDENDKMNNSVLDINGEILVVSNFTLYADTTRGNRPNFMNAMEPVEAERLYKIFVEELRKFNINVQTGVFGAHMSISQVNNGPVNVIIEA